MATGPGPTPVSLLLVDDHQVIAEAIAASLRVEGFHPVVVAEDLEPASILAAAEAVRPGIALIDLHLGPDVDGSTLIEPLGRLGVKVVVLTAVPADDRRGRCLQLGAVAVLDKAIPFTALVDTIRRVAAGEPAMRPAERDPLLAAAARADHERQRRQERFSALTQRERVVLTHLIAGRTAAEIATIDGVKLSTVRSQIQSVLSKLGVTTQQAAIAIAHREGFTPED